MDKRIVSGIVLLSVLLCLFVWIGTTYIQNGSKRYTHEPAGFSFQYSSALTAQEESFTDDLLLVTLVPAKAEAKEPTALEGEPRISCALFKNTREIPIDIWVSSPEYSILMGHLMEGTLYPSADIPNVEAIGFKTDGLYASDHVAFEHQGHIIDCSVGYITLDDPLRMEFALFIASLNLSSR